MEDNEIIELFWNRSEDAITETDKKYGSLCLRQAQHMLRSRPDAEECVNDTWLVLWNRIPPTRPDAFPAFLLKIVRYLALNRADYRNAQKRAERLTTSLDELTQCAAPGGDPLDAVQTQALTGQIERFLRAQDYESRNIFLRRYWYFDSIAEIAERFRLSENKVKSNLFRTRNRLRRTLVKEGYLDEA